ncbi:glycosyltransferase [Spongisporangium articulatum]|uniref:Glycosyltransferase n=1 Tax=Spongisporangium articulatum TaxID=3362603 RepID=A0ABW8AJ98_9ACTN
MSAQPTVTVCIPTYNRRALLANSLASVLEQDVDGLEIVVSDNASTDDTEEYVRSIGDPRITYDRLPENIGLFGNLSRALHVGSGRYRVMLPDDDLMLPGNLAAKVAFLEANPSAGMVHSAFLNLGDDGRPYGEPQNWSRLEVDTLEKGHDFIRRSIAIGGIVCVSSVMTRSSVVADERFDPDDGPYADIALWLRIANVSDVGFLAAPLSGYRVHAQSASSGFNLTNANQGGGETSRLTMSIHHADVTLQAHGRFVQRASLSPDEREELAEILRGADKRMRLSIYANAYIPPKLLETAKKAAGWRPGGLMHSKLSLDGSLEDAERSHAGGGSK